MREGKLTKVPRAYTCPFCGEIIRVIYLQPGEQARCNNCDQKSIIPETATVADIDKLESFQKEALVEGEVPEPEPELPTDPRIKAIKLLAWAMLIIVLPLTFTAHGNYVRSSMLGYLLAAGALARLDNRDVSPFSWALMFISLVVFFSNFLPIINIFRHPEFVWLLSTSNGVYFLLLFIFFWRVTAKIEPAPGVRWVFPLAVAIDIFVMLVSFLLNFLLPAAIGQAALSRTATLQAEKAIGIIVVALKGTASLSVFIAVVSALWALRRGNVQPDTNAPLMIANG